MKPELLESARAGETIIDPLPIQNDLIVHLLIVGETGSGKSTIAKKIAEFRSSNGKIIILDPHAIDPQPEKPGDWGYRKTVGSGRDYEAISASMEYLLNLLNNRYELRRKGQEEFEDLSIFIDEWPAIKSNCKNAPQFMKDVAREGRKVAMRLVILTQSPLVESLGLKGEGDTRENFSILFLGSKARKLGQFDPSLKFPGVLSYQGENYFIKSVGMTTYISTQPSGYYKVEKHHRSRPNPRENRPDVEFLSEITIEEGARLIGAHYLTVWRWLNAGYLKSARQVHGDTKGWYFSKRELLEVASKRGFVKKVEDLEAG